MANLDRLIEELCPDGVEYKTIEEIANLTMGTSPSGNTISENPNEGIEFHQGKSYFSDMMLQSSNVYTVAPVKLASAGSIIMSVRAPVGDSNITDREIAIGRGLCAMKGKESLDTKFLYYFIDANIHEIKKKSNGSTFESINTYDIKVMSIPIPPLPIQHEIVRILDKFTELTAELEAKLKTELETRKKQYEYYRDSLCDYSGRKGITFLSVADLFDFKNGLNKGKEFFGKGTPIVNFTDVFKKRWLTKDMLKGLVDVTPTEIDRYSAKKGDVFFTRTSETQEEIGMTSVLIDDVESCVFSGFVLRARPKTDYLLPKFCSYFFSARQIRQRIVQSSTFTTRALTSGPKLSRILVPIPPLSEQERIVAILDRFDALTTDISSGLPAEIEARRKQYEYYRDKLLTFKEKIA